MSHDFQYTKRKQKIAPRAEMAAGGKIEKHADNVGKLLLAVGKYMGWGSDISNVFVSDMSSIADFHLDKRQLRKISERVGVEIAGDEYLWQIAGRMTQKSA